MVVLSSPPRAPECCRDIHSLGFLSVRNAPPFDVKTPAWRFCAACHHSNVIPFVIDPSPIPLTPFSTAQSTSSWQSGPPWILIRIILINMSRFLHAVQGDLKLVHMHKEPPDLHGATPVPVILTKSTKHVEVFARRGSPFSLSDLGEFYNCRLIVQFSNMCYVQPAFIGAARNLSTVGINDRLRLACVVSFFFRYFYLPLIVYFSWRFWHWCRVFPMILSVPHNFNNFSLIYVSFIPYIGYAYFETITQTYELTNLYQYTRIHLTLQPAICNCRNQSLLIPPWSMSTMHIEAPTARTTTLSSLL